MTSDFLIQDEVKVQRFNSVEVEKIVSDHIIKVMISATMDFTTIRINEKERLMQIIQQPYIGDFNIADAGFTEKISFIIPACIEIQGYYVKKEKQKTCVIFNRADSNRGGANYFY